MRSARSRQFLSDFHFEAKQKTAGEIERADAFENKKVLGMLLEEFDAEKYERTIRSEGQEEVNRLGLLMTKAGRSDEFLKSLSNRELQKKLFVEFGLEEG